MPLRVELLSIEQGASLWMALEIASGRKLRSACCPKHTGQHPAGSGLSGRRPSGRAHMHLCSLLQPLPLFSAASP